MTLQYAGRHRTHSPVDQHPIIDTPTIVAHTVAANMAAGGLGIAVTDEATGNMIGIGFRADGVEILREALRLSVPTCASWADVQIEAS